MRTATAGLITLLSGNKLIMADLYEITLVTGALLRYTSFDSTLVYGGNNYLAVGPIFERSRTRLVVGTQVDSLDLTIHATDQHTVSGIPILQAIRNGTFDGAHLTLYRAFMSDPTLPPEALVQFVGRFSEIQLSRYRAEISIKSELELLNIPVPRNLYQAGCTNTLYDVGCGKVKSSYAVGSSVSSGSSRLVLNCGLAQASGYFGLGTITFTSGPNNGVTRTIKKYEPGVVTLAYPLPADPITGNTFNAYPGCDKTMTMCTSKFSNLVNFRGFPYVPVPETAF